MVYQLKSKFIHRLKKKEVFPTWGFLLLGLDGPGSFPPMLCNNEIIDFAIGKYLDGCTDTLVEKIAFSDKDETLFIREALVQLRERESIPGNDLRMWELLLLEDLLSELPDDPANALVELTSFWNSFGFPNDSPHIVQGKNNDLDPEEYYDERNYFLSLKKHQLWMKNTEAMLKSR